MAYKVSTDHAGHNAFAPGASGNGLKEHVVVRTISRKILEATKAVNCTDDAGRTANQNLVNIVQKMNRVGVGIHMSEHLNAFNRIANGFEVWYMAGNAAARKLAQDICNAVCAVTGWVNRGAKATTSLYVIRAAKGTSILIEWGFIDNKRDMDILNAKMDVAINALLSVLGYRSNTIAPPKLDVKSTKPSGLAKNTKPVTNGEVGDTVKVYDALYANSEGAGRSINSRGNTGKIKRIVGNGKKYLVENWGWAHPNDLQMVKRAGSGSSSASSSNTKTKSTPKVRQITVDGKWGAETTRRIQEVLGTPIDGIISGQDSRYIKNIPSARAGRGGSLVIKAMQNKLRIKADGYLGPNTIRAMQKHYGTPVDGFISPVSNVVMAMQRALNSNKF